MQPWREPAVIKQDGDNCARVTMLNVYIGSGSGRVEEKHLKRLHSSFLLQSPLIKVKQSDGCGQEVK